MSAFWITGVHFWYSARKYAASTSGAVRSIETRAIAHPRRREALCAVIEPDGQDEHWPQVRVVSITNSTEIGTVYTPDEIRALSKTFENQCLADKS